MDEIEGERGGTLTVLSLEASPDLDPARINDVYGTMIARAVHRTPYAFRPDRDGPQPDLAEGTPEISDDSRQVTITIRSGVHFSPPVNTFQMLSPAAKGLGIRGPPRSRQALVRRGRGRDPRRPGRTPSRDARDATGCLPAAVTIG